MAGPTRDRAILRSALLGAGIAALCVCLLAALDTAWRGRWELASFFAIPWVLLGAFLIAPSRRHDPPVDRRSILRTGDEDGPKH